MDFVVVTGNIVDGFTFYGPFPDADEAAQWAERELRGLDWVAAILYREVQ